MFSALTHPPNKVHFVSYLLSAFSIVFWTFETFPGSLERGGKSPLGPATCVRKREAVLEIDAWIRWMLGLPPTPNGMSLFSIVSSTFETFLGSLGRSNKLLLGPVNFVRR